MADRMIGGAETLLWLGWAAIALWLVVVLAVACSLASRVRANERIRKRAEALREDVRSLAEQLDRLANHRRRS